MRAVEYENLNSAQGGAEVDDFTAERYGQFVGYLPSSACTVLDVGSSTGRGGAALAEHRDDLTILGLDCLQSRLDQLPPAYSRGIRALSTEIPLDDRSVDVVVAGEFVEHLSEEHVASTFNQFTRVLVPGGVLMLTTPNPDYVRLKLTGGTVLGGAHLSQFTARQMVALLVRNGFADVIVRGSGRVSRILGERAPLCLYGSYLAVARKPAEVSAV